MANKAQQSGFKHQRNIDCCEPPGKSELWGVALEYKPTERVLRLTSLAVTVKRQITIQVTIEIVSQEVV